jgi:hypothetical protein
VALPASSDSSVVRSKFCGEGGASGGRLRVDLLQLSCQRLCAVDLAHQTLNAALIDTTVSTQVCTSRDSSGEHRNRAPGIRNTAALWALNTQRGRSGTYGTQLQAHPHTHTHTGADRYTRTYTYTYTRTYTHSPLVEVKAGAELSLALRRQYDSSDDWPWRARCSASGSCCDVSCGHSLRQVDGVLGAVNGHR